MTRLRRILLSGFAAALFAAGAASESYAVEPGDFTNYLRGATQGLPLGALPPPGIYGSFSPNATGLGPSQGNGNQAQGVQSNPAFGYGFSLLFVPGWTFLGASYGAAVVQGFYFSTGGNTPVSPPFTAGGPADPELANTSFTPIALSWALGHGWFVSGAFSIVGPDGSQWRSAGGAVNLNPDFWTFAPGFAVSYLDASWTLSANFLYDINTASRGVTMANQFMPAGSANGYVSGNELFGDFTGLYKFGKWSIGPVGYFEAQTTGDKPGGGVACTPALCGMQTQIAVGGLVGYDFGPVAVQVWADNTAFCKNAICGTDVWGRMSFRILGFEGPKPLVAKN